MADWFLSSTPVLSQLGATIGRGLTPASMTQTAQQEALVSRYLAEQQRQADRDYLLNKQKLDREYQVARQNARTNKERNEIDRWYNQQQVEIAQNRLMLDAKIHEDTLGLNRAKLGYDLLGLQASLRGPEDYFAASNLARGVAAQPGTATFLDALKNNTQLAGFGAQAGAPDAVSVNSLMAKMGGGGSSGSLMPGTGASATDALHRQIQGIGAAGAHKLGAGSLEQLTDTELKLLMGGLGTPGPDGKAFDVPTFLDQYRRSRIGQGVGNVQAA